MGVFRWMGGKLAAPVTLRKRAYDDLREGVSSSARAARRGLRLRSRAEPPIIPGTSEREVDSVYMRWSRLSGGQRKTAWREFDQIMRILMQQEAEETGSRWSLDVPDAERAEQYALSYSRARKAMWIYAGLMGIPVALAPWHGGQAIYWLNLIAAATILSPGLLRHLIIRAQIFHGGRVSFRQVFCRYPAELPGSQLKGANDAGAEAQTTGGMVRSGSFPMLAWLYGVSHQEGIGGGA